METRLCPSPCETCEREKTCSDKNCKQWRKWFLRQWEETRRLLGALDQKPEKPRAIMVGGRAYYHPDAWREYLSRNPCTACASRSKCKVVCKEKIDWTVAKVRGGQRDE